MGLERGGDNLSREMADIHYKEQTMTGNDAASYIAYPAFFGLDSLGTSSATTVSSIRSLLPRLWLPMRMRLLAAG